MKIESILWLQAIVEKIDVKHGVEIHEVEEVFEGRPKFRRLEKGRRKGEDVYMALGQTRPGRYLAVVFIHKKDHRAFILSARDMAPRERKRYAEK